MSDEEKSEIMYRDVGSGFLKLPAKFLEQLKGKSVRVEFDEINNQLMVRDAEQ